MTMPSISVCILNYNYGRYLGQAIDSALGQQPGGYRLAEIVVVDDGSTDNSLEICSSYGERITTIACAHRGFAATLTEAVQQAQGEWIALLDADDCFVPTKLTTVAKSMALGEPLLIQHWEHVVDQEGIALLDRPHPGGNMSTLVVRREAALDLLPVTNEVFFHVFAYLGRCVRLLDPLISYRVHGSNMTNRTEPGVWQDYLEKVSDEVTQRLRALAQNPPAWTDRRTLRRLAWHFAATAHGHAREAAVQRRQRGAAFKATSAELFMTLVARRALMARLEGLRSAVIMRPTIILGPGVDQGS